MQRRAALAATALAGVLLAGGCAGGSGSATLTPTGSGATQPTAAASPVGSPASSSVASPAASSIASPAAGEFANPVIGQDFPDPFVAEFDGVYYAYATGGGGQPIRAARSEDLVNWEVLSGVMSRAGWITRDTWAPEVAQTSAGYVMYYSGRRVSFPRANGENTPCITIAIADSPAGHFVDESSEPLVCQQELGGSIDPTRFVDANGTPYLIWKSDGNCCGLPVSLWMQELSEDGLELVGDGPVNLGVTNDERWEGRLIEAPTLLLRDGTYYLFYSANAYESIHYAVGVATSDTLEGPYEDMEINPILTTEAPAVGPGHQSIVADDEGDLWMAYHAWDVNAVGYGVGGQRTMWIDELVFEGDEPDVLGPDAGPQAAP